MDEAGASLLLDEAISRPLETYKRADVVLADPTVDDAVASIVLRAKGMAGRSVAPIVESIAALDEAVRRAGRADRTDLAQLAQVTLAGSLYIAGRADEALDLLARVAAGAGPSAPPTIDFQRATLLARAGRLDEAVELFDGVLDRFVAAGDDMFVASTFGNRGLTRLDRGEAGAAHADLGEARRRFAELGAVFKVATMDHNLGRVAGRRGDLVQALQRFADAERQLSDLGEDVAEIQANRVEVLLEAGLFAEAATVAASAEQAMAKVGLELDRAELALAQGLAHLGLQDPRAAIEHAERSAELFAVQQRPGWADEATVVAMRARVANGMAVDVPDAAAVARSLVAGGRRLAALQAWSVVAVGDPLVAADEARRVEIPIADQPIEVRLVRAEIEAREQLALGQISSALRSTRQAVALANRQRLAVDAVDVRAGIGAHLTAIAQFGLAIRRDRGRPLDLVRWVDATRGGALDVPTRPVPPDPRIEDLVSRLRSVQLAGRDGDPHTSGDLLRERARLQRVLVAAQRADTPGRRRVRGLPRGLAELADERRIIQFHRRGRRLGAVVIDHGSARVVDLCAVAQVDAAATTLRFALMRLLSAAVEPDVAQRRADELAALLVAPLTAGRDGAPTVVVPLPQHQRLPWSLLRPLDGATLTVAPTLRHWVNSRPRGASSRGTTIAVVEGPDVLTSTTELQRVADAWSARPRVSVRRPVDTVDAALAALASADVVHVAAHGVRREGDGRFAQLVLRDGDLTAFDLERLPSAASLVILSACEAGVVDALPGEESIGLSTALFDRGCDTVVAGTLPLPDSAATAGLFGRIHELLAMGRTPAAALHDSQAELGASAQGMIARSVSCFGRG